MEEFIYRKPNEEENEYRLRIWKSRELWDSIEIEWKEDDIENYVMQKMLAMKQQVYAMNLDDIDKEIEDTIKFMPTIDVQIKPHEYIWCEMYIYYLKERKTEFQMEVGMKRCRI